MFKEMIMRRNKAIFSQPSEVIFCKIERPATLRDRFLYILESLGNAIFRCDGHVYSKVIDAQISETFDSPEHSIIIYLTIWECTSCHFKQMMIMKKEMWYS
jgi:hypothetical protein